MPPTDLPCAHMPSAPLQCMPLPSAPLPSAPLALREMARIVEANGPEFADRVFAALRGAHPGDLFDAAPSAADALALLVRRRDLMASVDLW